MSKDGICPPSRVSVRIPPLGCQKGVLPSGILGKSHEMFPDPPVTDLEEASSETLLIQNPLQFAVTHILNPVSRARSYLTFFLQVPDPSILQQSCVLCSHLCV